MFNKMFRNLFSPTPHPSDLSLETIAKAVRAGEAAVVDVREPHEFGLPYCLRQGNRAKKGRFRRRMR